MKLIGLVGRKSVGKDTAAMVLAQEGYHIAKFAGGLKEMLRAYLRYSGAEAGRIEQLIEDYRFKETPCLHLEGQTPRFAMQTLGTEWGRDTIGKNLWVNACMFHCAQFEKAVITDVRFPNEVAAVKQAGGVVVRISRAASRDDSHASESFIDTLDVDFELNNNGSIEELHRKILTIVARTQK